jgi:hypothetical protein
LTATASGATAAALYGSNTRTNGANFGVFGSSASAGAGTGVYASETGASNTGYALVAANSSASGYGIYASGTSPNLFTGSVGIGSVPAGILAPLDVSGLSQSIASTNGIGMIRATDSGVDKGGSLVLGGNDGVAVARTFGSIVGFKENGTSGDYSSYMAFATRANGSMPAERMRISSAGKVGINTTSPAAYLDVNGAIRVSDTGQNCNSGSNGAIRFNSSSHKLQFCYSLAWADVGSGAIGAAAGSDTQVQLNNNGVMYASSGLTFNSSSGQLTVSKNLSVGGATADASHSIQTPVAGFSITIGNKVGTLTLTPAGTIASGTITLPAAPINGQVIHITSTQNITTLTIAPNAGQTLANAIHMIAATAPVSYMYDAPGTKWYRVQ